MELGLSATSVRITGPYNIVANSSGGINIGPNAQLGSTDPRAPGLINGINIDLTKGGQASSSTNNYYSNNNTNNLSQEFNRQTSISNSTPLATSKLASTPTIAVLPASSASSTETSTAATQKVFKNSTRSN